MQAEGQRGLRQLGGAAKHVGIWNGLVHAAGEGLELQQEGRQLQRRRQLLAGGGLVLCALPAAVELQKGGGKGGGIVVKRGEGAADTSKKSAHHQGRAPPVRGLQHQATPGRLLRP